MKYLVDSDFLVGLSSKNDPHHTNCKKIFADLCGKNVDLVALNLVVQETATVISKKISQKESLRFIELFRNLPIQLILLDLELENSSWRIFEKQTKKGTSYVDCANIAAVEKYKFEGILSFDKFYPKKYQRYLK